MIFPLKWAARTPASWKVCPYWLRLHSADLTLSVHSLHVGHYCSGLDSSVFASREASANSPSPIGRGRTLVTPTRKHKARIKEHRLAHGGVRGWWAGMEGNVTLQG